jgi:hypothetical protein
MNCLICLARARDFSRDSHRKYLECTECSLVFVPRHELVSDSQEKERYDHHQNSASDPHYQSYLQNIVSSLRPYLHPGDVGLDFGCGKAKVMEELLQNLCLRVNSFDLYYHRREDFLKDSYNFIIMSEVIEHLRTPLPEMRRLSALLKPKGMIFIKTRFLPKREEFSNWFYKRDITHVQFFNDKSLNVLADRLGLSHFEVMGEDLFLLRKN